ncbi:MAG: hypothetical protein NVS1B6_15010 [Steroidobacteraceae bacterium]
MGRVVNDAGIISAGLGIRITAASVTGITAEALVDTPMFFAQAEFL